MRWLIGCAAAFLLASPLPAQGLEYVKANYTKHEYNIPMRDGVRLFTAVYVPKDASAANVYPILLNRTPYSAGPYGAEAYKENLGPSALLARARYIFAYQDARGMWMSEGQFAEMRPHRAKKGPRDIDESTDTYDTVDWLLKNVGGNNGRVGQWGVSYDGFYAAAAMIDAHPALKAVSPQAPMIDWFIGDDVHHNGALFLMQNFMFYYHVPMFEGGRPGPTSRAPPPRPPLTENTYDFFLKLGPVRNADEKYFHGRIPFWTEIMGHETRDALWKSLDLRPHLKKIRPAVMTVGGWFDAEDLFGPLAAYRTIERSSPQAFNVLVMGPWVHGGWSRGPGESLGGVSFNSATAEFYREQIEKPFFDAFLKGTGAPKLPEAYVFETGANRWRTFDQWPPKQAAPRALYLHSGGGLSFSKPQSAQASPFDEYVSDPANPVPYTATKSPRTVREYMIEDQRFAAARKDVLSYQTPPLEEDVTVGGPLTASLYVSTSGTDSDWVIKLIDVYPEGDPKLAGMQQLVRGDVMRGKFRNSFEKPQPFKPNQPARVEFAIPDVLHTFKRGHRIMVQIQSSWFPLVDRNPQKFINIRQASESDFQMATQRVYHSSRMPSQIRVLVLPPMAAQK